MSSSDADTKTGKNTGEIVITPNRNDVLCGRGSGVNTFSGNIFFRELVRLRKDMYRKVKRHQKIPIAEEIIDTITNLDPPGRFLIRNKEGTCWYVHSRKQSMVKTAQALREGATKRERMIDSYTSHASGNGGSVSSLLGHSYSCGTSSSDGEETCLTEHEIFLTQQNPDCMKNNKDMVSMIFPHFPSSIYPHYNSNTGMNGTSMLVVAQQLQQYDPHQQQPHVQAHLNHNRRLLLRQVFRTEHSNNNKVHIPPITIHNPLNCKYLEDNSGRFDDPDEEQMDTSLQVFIAAVQMRRRMLAE